MTLLRRGAAGVPCTRLSQLELKCGVWHLPSSRERLRAQTFTSASDLPVRFPQIDRHPLDKRANKATLPVLRLPVLKSEWRAPLHSTMFSNHFNSVHSPSDRKLHVQNIRTCSHHQPMSYTLCFMTPHACKYPGQPSTRDAGNELHPEEHGQHRLTSLASHKLRRKRAASDNTSIVFFLSCHHHYHHHHHYSRVRLSSPHISFCLHLMVLVPYCWDAALSCAVMKDVCSNGDWILSWDLTSCGD